MPVIELQIHTAQLQLLADCLQQAIARDSVPRLATPMSEHEAVDLLGAIEITLEQPDPGALHSLCDTFPAGWEPQA